MKKKFFIALLAVVAAFAAAVAIGGCKFKDGSSSDLNEYVVWNDGYGKTYTLRGGENVVAYYPCEPDKILNFSYVYYNSATGEATREVAGRGRLNLGEPSVWTWSDSAYPKKDGVEKACTLTVVVCSGNVYSIKQGETQTVGVEADVGAALVFVPEYSAYYAVECSGQEDAESKVSFTVTQNGKAHRADDYYIQGRTYIIFVNISEGESWVNVAVNYAPPEIKEGENKLTVKGFDGQTFKFTPRKSGYYTIKDSIGTQFGVAYSYEGELINGYGLETDLYFEEGGDYYIKCVSGVSTEVENYIISVLPVDKSIGEGESVTSASRRMYKLTARYSGYYTFDIESQNGDTQVEIVSWENAVHENFTVGITLTERQIFLPEGECYFKAEGDVNVKYKFAPRHCKGSVNKNETRLFTPAFSGEYAFATIPENVSYKITNAQSGEEISGALNKGESYFITFNALCNVEPKAVAASLAHNTKFALSGRAVTAFTPPFSGAYKFFDALNVELYDREFNAVQSECGNYNLEAESLYYAVVEAEEGVTVKFNPPAVICDGKTALTDCKWARLELLQEGTVNIASSLGQSLTVYDGQLKQIQKFGSALNATLENCAAGPDYLFADSLSCIKFNVTSASRTVVELEENVGYVVEKSSVFRIACGTECKSLTAETFIGWKKYTDGDFKLYYLDGGQKRYLDRRLSLDVNDSVIISFTLNGEVGEYFLEVEAAFAGNFKYTLTR